MRYQLAHEFTLLVKFAAGNIYVFLNVVFLSRSASLGYRSKAGSTVALFPPPVFFGKAFVAVTQLSVCVPQTQSVYGGAEKNPPDRWTEKYEMRSRPSKAHVCISSSLFLRSELITSFK